MNTRQVLRAQLVKCPTDRTLAGALADYLFEECEYTRFAALRHVARIRRDERNSRELALAVTHLDFNADLYTELMEHIVEHLGPTAQRYFALVVVPGSRPPVQTCKKEPRGSNWVTYTYTVTVGARWVNRMADETFDQWEFELTHFHNREKYG